MTEVRIVAPAEGDLRRLSGAHYEVYLDGRAVFPAETVITLSANGVPRVELDFLHATVCTFEGTAHVVLAPGIEDTLLGLGWTPPEATPEPDAPAPRASTRRRVDLDTTDDLGRELLSHAENCSSHVNLYGTCDCELGGDR